MSGQKREMERIWKTVLLLSCLVATCAAASSPAAAKGVAAGRLDPSFGKGGKAMVAFPAENAGNVGITYGPFPAFTPGHLEMAQTPGGKIVVAGSTRLARFLPNGKLDPSFGRGGLVSIARPPGMSFVLASVAVDSQGRILLGGSARPLPTSSTLDPLLSSAMVMRFGSNGAVDGSFGSGGTVISDFGIKPPEIGTTRYKGAAVGLRSITVDSLGRPLVTGGSVTKVINCSGTETAISTGFVGRLTEAGALDTSFGEVSLFPDGDLFTVGLAKPRCSGEGGGSPVVLTGFASEGYLDPGFGFAGFRAIGYPQAPVATVARSGKIVLLGAKDRDGKQQVMRLLPNGAADPSFGRIGRIQLVGPGHAALAALALDSRDRIVLAGRVSRRVSKKAKNPLLRSTFLVIRLSPGGRVDRSFGRKGVVGTGFGGPSDSFATQVILDAKGRIVVGGGIKTPRLGTGGGFAIARYLGGR
jgi:uncharacterized delta-60 repeat protein